MIQIAPSLLAADFTRLKEEIDSIPNADLLHIDVMDGLFVPNLAIGTAEVQAIRKITQMPLDVHLMIQYPERYVERFADLGANIITFHLESDCNAADCIQKIRAKNVLPGIVIKPGTPAQETFPYLKDVAMVLVMTVEPGFGGQKCMEECFDKVHLIREESDRQGLNLHIEVDGGITEENAPRAIAAGADVLVAGSSVFHAENRMTAIKRMKGN